MSPIETFVRQLVISCLCLCVVMGNFCLYGIMAYSRKPPRANIVPPREVMPMVEILLELALEIVAGVLVVLIVRRIP